MVLQGAVFSGFDADAKVRDESAGKLGGRELHVSPYGLAFAQLMEHIVGAYADDLPSRGLVSVLDGGNLAVEK